MATQNNGLTWQRTTDAIRAFVRQYGSMAPRRATFCTFDFGVERFEAVVLPELLRRARQFRTLVAADAGALQAQLREIGDRRFGRYQVAPVRCTRGGVFHPKVIFLAAGPRRLVGVGSANLTSGGLGGNLELMLFADDASEFGRQLVGGAARFLDRLLIHGSTQMPASAREFIRTMLAGTPRVPDTILDSLDVPLLQQMVDAHFGGTRRRTIQRLTILSPWHSSGASPDGVSATVLSQLRSSFKPAAAAVFTDGLNHTGPALGRGIAVHIRGDALKTAIEPDDVDDEPERVLNRRPTRVHVKAYLAEAAAGGGTLFFGSANCTQPALLRPASKGGNVEILVMSVLDRRAVQAFGADLKDLFQPARSTVAVAPAAAPARPAGDILAGNLLNKRGGVHLERF